MVNNYIQLRSDIYSLEDTTNWDRMHPYMLAPGIIPVGPEGISNIEKIISAEELRIVNIDSNAHPEWDLKKFYSDGKPISWDNLDEMNVQYLEKFKRITNIIRNIKDCKDDGRKIPEISASYGKHDVDIIRNNIDAKLEKYDNTQRK